MWKTATGLWTYDFGGYFVKLVNGRVQSFVKMSDLDTGKATSKTQAALADAPSRETPILLAEQAGLETR